MPFLMTQQFYFCIYTQKECKQGLLRVICAPILIEAIHIIAKNPSNAMSTDGCKDAQKVAYTYDVILFSF